MTAASSRNQWLDILRGIAILLVLGSHYEYFRIWVRVGWAGVDLFFVLSGFLISGLLFSEYKKTGVIDLKRFWLRRGMKIYPPFYFFMAATVAAMLFQHRAITGTILSDLFFLQNYFSCVWDHGWSLAVEEHFYLVLPLLLVVLTGLCKRKADPFRAIPLLSIGLTVLCLALRMRAFVHEEPWKAIAQPTHLRIDSLFAGVTLGYYKHFRGEELRRSSKTALALAGAVFLAPVALLSLSNSFMASTFTLAFLGFGCILLSVADRPYSRNTFARILAWIGYYSYSIYLWHAMLVGLVFRFLQPTLALFVIYLVCCIALGVFMTKLIETRSLALRDGWIPSRTVQAGVKPFPVQLGTGNELAGMLTGRTSQAEAR
ncbi:MAG TPA: acyltransferase [Terriglobia bacterium]|nr:acyltransferase [Terriglobia bacterium]